MDPSVSERLIAACNETYGSGDDLPPDLGRFVAEVIHKRGPAIREAIQEGGSMRRREMSDVLRLIDLAEGEPGN